MNRREWQDNAIRFGLAGLVPGDLVTLEGKARPALYVGVSPAGVIWLQHYRHPHGYNWQAFSQQRQALAALWANDERRETAAEKNLF